MCLNRKTDLLQLCLHNVLYSLCTSQFQNRPCPSPPWYFTGVLLRTVGNLSQNEARQVGQLTVVSKRWSSSEAKGSRNSFIPHVHNAFTGRCSYIHCFVGPFENLWSSLLNVGFLEWTILWKWRNRRKTCTAFQDFRWVSVVSSAIFKFE